MPLVQLRRGNIQHMSSNKLQLSPVITRFNFIRYCVQHNSLKSWWCHQLETFPRYWPFLRGNYRSQVGIPRKGQWRGALMFSLICAWTSGWANSRGAGDGIHHRAQYVVTVMYMCHWNKSSANVSLIFIFKRSLYIRYGTSYAKTARVKCISHLHFLQKKMNIHKFHAHI